MCLYERVAYKDNILQCIWGFKIFYISIGLYWLVTKTVNKYTMFYYLRNNVFSTKRVSLFGLHIILELPIITNVRIKMSQHRHTTMMWTYTSRCAAVRSQKTVTAHFSS